jgi:diguanylate cyclase (GGDEF)-like protein
MFGPEESVPAVGSLLIVPMTQEQRVVGAIVVAGNGPGEVVASDIDPLRTVATIATASLDRLADLEKARLVSKTDELTGLSNRRHFDDQLARLVGEAERRQQPISLIVLDVDHFKRVNDSHGHEAGDAVLRSVARSLENGVRAVANGDLCARYGGEELAVLLPNVPAMEAMEIAERLRLAISAKGVMYHGKRIDVTASFGVTSYPETARTATALFPSADRALYQAKAGGRNLVKSAGVSDSAAATSTSATLAKPAVR